MTLGYARPWAESMPHVHLSDQCLASVGIPWSIHHRARAKLHDEAVLRARSGRPAKRAEFVYDGDRSRIGRRCRADLASALDALQTGASRVGHSAETLPSSLLNQTAMLGV